MIRKKCCVLLLACLVCAAAYGQVSPRVRVLTYNIHHGEGTDKKFDLERIARVIQSAEPDIVCLQEVDNGCERTQRLDFPAELAKRLRMKVAFGPNLQLQGGWYGVATLSRFDIIEHENLALPTPEGAEPRGALRCVFDVEGRRLTVWNTHWGLHADERKAQATFLFDRLGDTLTLFAGDLNESAADPSVGILLRRLMDSFSAEAGAPTGTIGSAGAGRRIDFILASKDVHALSSRILVAPETDLASDHRPYVADLALPIAREDASDRGVYDEDDERIIEAVTGGMDNG